MSQDRHDPEEVEIAEAHHVQGLGPRVPKVFTAVLDQLNIERHELPFNHGKNGGGLEVLAVEFALTCYEAATEAPLDLVVLINGDLDYIPLVDWLIRVQALLPRVRLTFASDVGFPQSLATAPRLLERATHMPTFDDLLNRIRESGGERP